MIDALLERHQARLLARCPSVPEVPPEEAARLPIQTTTWGDGGPTVILVHGGVQGTLGGGPKTFDRQEALAARGYRVVRVARPGFGESPSRGADDVARDAVWIADMLGDGAHLVGHSWGGAECLLAAARRPSAVRSLILVEPALQKLLAGNLTPEDRSPALLLASARLLARLLVTRSPGAYARAFARQMGPAAGGLDLLGVLERDPALAETMGASLLRGRMASATELRRAADAVAAAGIPTLVVTGGWSPSFDVVGKVAARLTGGRHVVVPSPNHFVQFVRAGDFDGVVDGFLRGVEARPIA